MTIEIFNSSDTWTCPDGVTSLEVECWGGGGGGGNYGFYEPLASSLGGGGGGGGGYAKKTISVVPTTIYTIFIGAGGGPVTIGENTWFDSETTVIALGGEAGDVYQAGLGAMGGNGIGDITYDGGSGGSGQDMGNGGGGGSSAGSSSNGQNGQNGDAGSLGATAPTDGGNGGDGVINNAFPTDGAIPGGGGGGGGQGNMFGSSGGGGRVRLTYTASELPASIIITRPLSHGLNSRILNLRSYN